MSDAVKSARRYEIRFRAEWRRMVLDPLWFVYGRPVSKRDEDTYVSRKFDELAHWNRHNEDVLDVVRAWHQRRAA